MAAAGYRISQGMRALLASCRPVDLALATQHLDAAQLALFQRLGRSEQLHSLNVLRDILTQETATPPELAQAALLHDVGKCRARLAIWQKALGVVVHRLMPQRFARWSADDTRRGWRLPFVVYAHHPAWGAAELAAIDSPQAVQWLVAHHADDPESWRDHPLYAQLCRLQQADDRN